MHICVFLNVFVCIISTLKRAKLSFTKYHMSIKPSLLFKSMVPESSYSPPSSVQTIDLQTFVFVQFKLTTMGVNLLHKPRLTPRPYSES